MDDFIYNDQLFDEVQFIKGLGIDYKDDSNKFVKTVKYTFRSQEPKK